jgi:hypothetical protein
MSRISAFISYSHDSPEHSARVLAFAQALRANGIDIELDQFHSEQIVDWPRWCNEQTSREFHDFVLCVCTAEYRRRIDGHVAPEAGKGVHWEGSLLDDEVYDAKGNARIVPVLFDDDPESGIPRFLSGWTRCRVKEFVLDDAGFEQLLRILTGQATVVKQPLGPIPSLPSQAARAPARPRIAEQEDERTRREASRVAPSRLTHVADRLFGREAEFAKLDAAWKPGSGIRVVTIVAWGGVGKTSLVAKWAATLAARDYDGADYFDWSFYSQGARDQSGASADHFIQAALEFFGDGAMAHSPASAWDKGARLAQVVAQRRTLLILDGLEPLQHPPGPQAGELKDPAVTALLRGLAGKNAGLCVVTSRECVADLAQFRDITAPEWKLEQLSNVAGAALVKSLGVQGADDEITQLVTDVRGHALTLQLLGRFLADAHGGDIRYYKEVKFEDADLENQGRSAFEVMIAYERWLQSAGPERGRELALLRLTGLFDRPMSRDCLQALRAEPAIPGLTDSLVRLKDPLWNIALKRLGEIDLLTLTADAVDAHPLIREYFAKQLRDTQPTAFQAAHSRLFDHLCQTTEHRPDTLDGLQPLYEAVVHGCLAGRQQEVCDEVYIDRILRGTGDDGFYSMKNLGAIGADLAAVTAFFDEPWDRVSANLIEAARAWLLNEAASRLRALGRMTEALQPMRAGLEMRVQQRNWQEAAKSASNLSELEVTLGRLTEAVADARRSVTDADKSGDAFQQMVNRTTAADALHQSGQRAEAGSLFADAERMQKEQQPQFDMLYSLQGFRYCDWLLAPAERDVWQAPIFGTGSQFVIAKHGEDGAAKICAEVERRARTTLRWMIDVGAPLLSVALEHLTLARVGLIRSVLSDALPQPALDLPHVAAAVKGLRDAGTSDYLPKGLLTAALYHVVRGDAAAAHTALDQAQEIAERGPMPLYLADIHLHRARLFRNRAELAKARELIQKHGYGRRNEELEDAETAARNWPA